MWRTGIATAAAWSQSCEAWTIEIALSNGWAPRSSSNESGFPALAANEFYWTDLEGLEVRTTAGEVLGKVDHLLATGANDVLVIGGSPQHLIPFIVGPVVKQVDLAGSADRRRLVDGLLRARMFRFGVVSLFPELVAPVMDFGVVGRAAERGLVTLEQVSPRDFATDRHRTVDDRPYGGGPGMVLKYEPLRDAVHALRASVAGGLSRVRADGAGSAVRPGARTRACGGAGVAARLWTLRRHRRAVHGRRRSRPSCRSAITCSPAESSRRRS